MQSSQELTYQILIYAVIGAIYLGVIVSIVMSSGRLKRWIGIGFLIGFLENVVAFPAALMGYQPHQWILGKPATTLYLHIVLLAMCSTLAAYFLFTRSDKLPQILSGLPRIAIDHNRLQRVLMVVSMLAAMISVVLSATGYVGYFTAEAHTYKPPVWLDAARTLINTGTALTFVILLAAFATHGRLGMREWLLMLLWAFAGIVSAFKTLVVLPFFFALVAAWLIGRTRVAHWVTVFVALMLAYTVVEPMRNFRWGENTDNALTGLNTIVSEGDLRTAGVTDVVGQVLNRIDYSGTAVEVLEADESGQLDAYRGRLREIYSLIPALAFVPGALWPSKPLADLGRDLSIVLFGLERNSVTPSAAVNSYLWLGFAGVLINGFLNAYFLVLSARVIDAYVDRPLEFAPAMVLVLAFSAPESIKAYQYIGILRVGLCVWMFYLVAKPLGMLSAIMSTDTPTRPGVRCGPAHSR